jgi:hypothetical protein
MFFSADHLPFQFQLLSFWRPGATFSLRTDQSLYLFGKMVAMTYPWYSNNFATR